MKKYKNLLLSILTIFFSGCVIDYETNRVKIGGTQFYDEKWYINPNIEESKMLGSSTSDYGAAAEKKRDRYIIKYFDYQGKEIPQKDLKKIKSSRKFWRSNLTREQYMESKKRNFARNLQEFVFVDDNMSYEKFSEASDNGVTLYHTSGTRAEYIKTAQENIKVDDWEDNPNQFYYIKDENGKFIINSHISEPHLSYVVIPIKQCFENGWCEVYPSERYPKTTFYVKKSALLDYTN